MLRITPQLNADAAKKYQAQHLSKGDYYLSESENYGRWQGQGAEMLGLKEGSVISKRITTGCVRINVLIMAAN